MYYTIFYKGKPYEHKIIHKKPKEQSCEEPPLFSFPEFFTVKKKPTLAEAQVIFNICRPETLSGCYEGETEELK